MLATPFCNWRFPLAKALNCLAGISSCSASDCDLMGEAKAQR
jgi:hypothetical protein